MEHKFCQSCGMSLAEEIDRQSRQNLIKEQAKEMMRRFFPHLKRRKDGLLG